MIAFLGNGTMLFLNKRNVYFFTMPKMRQYKSWVCKNCCKEIEADIYGVDEKELRENIKKEVSEVCIFCMDGFEVVKINQKRTKKSSEKL